MEHKRGKHEDILTNAAIAVAKEYMQRAKANPDYANGQYEADMLREELYAKSDRQLNGKQHRLEVSAVKETYIGEMDLNMYRIVPAPPK